MTEADEQCYGKQTALTRLFSVCVAGETMGVVAMYERAALRQGATLDETERTIAAGRAEAARR